MAVTTTDLQTLYPTETLDKTSAYLQAWLDTAELQLDPAVLGEWYDSCHRELAMYFISTEGVSGHLKSISSSVSGGSGSVSVGSLEENTHWIRYQGYLRRAVGLAAMTAGGGSW